MWSLSSQSLLLSVEAAFVKMLYYSSLYAIFENPNTIFEQFHPSLLLHAHTHTLTPLIIILQLSELFFSLHLIVTLNTIHSYPLTPDVI